MVKSITILILCLLVSSQVFARRGTCEESYVPEHTSEELWELRDWAQGSAFAVYAKQAGYSFDRAAFMETCPNMALLGFGIKTGRSCLEIDINAGNRNLQNAFTTYWRIQENAKTEAEQTIFQDYYEKKAVELGIDIYLTPLSSSAL